jgi:hypothetical protein
VKYQLYLTSADRLIVVRTKDEVTTCAVERVVPKTCTEDLAFYATTNLFMQEGARLPDDVNGKLHFVKELELTGDHLKAHCVHQLDSVDLRLARGDS